MILPRLRPLWLLPVLLLVLAGMWLAGSRVQAIDRPAINTALLATVRLAVPVDDHADSYSIGSGTFISSDGLILTNYHVVADDETGQWYNRQGLAFVAITPADLRSEAVWTYRARIVKTDTTLDLAVLRLTGLMADNSPLPAQLDLTAIPLGTSRNLLIGDELNIFGFPSIGRGSVTFTRGIVAGFVDQNADGELDWIKTDADIASGNSGGLATDSQGHMVGIPSASVADTKTGAALNLVRPVDLALPLIRVAQGQNASDSDPTNTPANEPSAKPAISDVIFATTIDPDGHPLDAATQFAPGSKAVYAVFRYDNFANGGSFRYAWLRDGERIAGNEYRWQGGASGMDWVNVYSQSPLDSGRYELQLYWQDDLLYTGNFWIGEAPPVPASAHFGPIVFASGIDENEKPVKPAQSFSDIDTIYAFFSVQDMPAGTRWTRRWFIEGEQVLETSAVWDGPANADWWISVKAENGLPQGRYRLALYIGDRLDQQADFTVTAPHYTQGIADVQVIGTITDARRASRKISGATVFILKPGVRANDFLAHPTQEQVFAWGTSDSNGDYRLNERLTPGVSYGIVVYHRDYQMVTSPSYTIDATATSPWRIDITMRRK